VTLSKIVLVILLAAPLMGGCGEWRPYYLVNPTTGRETACFTPWGSSLPPDVIHNLHDCIAECEAHGFELEHPQSVPPEPMPVRNPRRQGWTQCERS